MIGMPKDENRRLLFLIRERIQYCEKRNWSRNIGAGFILEDIKNISPGPESDRFRLHYSDSSQTFNIDDLNLRELDAVKDFMARKLCNETLNQTRNK